MNGHEQKLLVMITTGQDDGGKKATLGFSAACCSAAMGTKTSIFLVGDGAAWGYEGHGTGVHHPGFPPLEDLITDFLDVGGEVLICSACDQVCTQPVLSDGAVQRRHGFSPRGMAAVLSDMEGASSLTF